MRTSKRILLLGPGESSRRFKVSELDRITTVSFSGNLDWLAENNVYSDYWTFFDPNSTMYIFDRIENGAYSKDWVAGLRTKTKLLCNEFIGKDEFYAKGYTTSKGPQWNRDVFGGQILPKLSEDIFGGIETVDQSVNQNTYDSFYQDSRKCPLVVHTGYDPQGRKLNTDKFSCFILPLVLSYFTDLREIYSVGFGDFEAPRVNTGKSLGYASYQISFDMMKDQAKGILKHKGATIKFINEDSYYKDLE